MVYVHARTPPVYGGAPQPQAGHAELCIRDSNFDISKARNRLILRKGRRSISPMKPTMTMRRPRPAGIQRPLALAAYDAYPINGIQGVKTQAALNKSLNDNKLPADALSKPEFFDTLLDAAANPQGAGLSWCNDIKHTMRASLGIVEMGAIITRGWYHLAAGQCLRPDLRRDPHQSYSYAEAADAQGRTIRGGDTPLA
jgi:hypothetical protein